MRGCLSIVVLAVAFILGATWFFGSDVAAVTVAADPPFELLVGHADDVRINSEHATLDQFAAAQLDMTLTDVDLVSRRFAHVDGNLTDVTMHTSDDQTFRASTVKFSGDGDAAATTIRVDHETVVSMAIATIGHQLGVPASNVKLSAPNGISFSTGSSTIAGRLVIVDGGLAVSASLPGNPRIDLIRPTGGLRFTSVSVRDDDLVLTAALNVEALLT
jgi:hypothetical protein